MLTYTDTPNYICWLSSFIYTSICLAFASLESNVSVPVLGSNQRSAPPDSLVCYITYSFWPGRNYLFLGFAHRFIGQCDFIVGRGSVIHTPKPPPLGTNPKRWKEEVLPLELLPEHMVSWYSKNSEVTKQVYMAQIAEDMDVLVAMYIAPHTNLFATACPPFCNSSR